LSTFLKAELTRFQAVRQALPTATPWGFCHHQTLLGNFACFNEVLSKENLNMVHTVSKRLINALFKCSYTLTEARFSSTALLTMVEKWIGVLRSEDAKGVIPWVSETVLEQLKVSSVNISTLKRLWLHQANVNMNRLITTKILNKERSFLDAPTILDRIR
jgi:hypothetical protein